MRVIPAVVSRFIAAQQQNRIASGVEGIKHPVWLTCVLNAQLTQLLGRRDARTVGELQSHAEFFQQIDHDGYAGLLFLGQFFSPLLEFFGKENLNCHRKIIPYHDYSVNGLHPYFVDQLGAAV
jgi:hypothetical protein